MKSSTQQLTEGFTVSIRDKAKAQRKKMMARDILINTSFNEQQLISLKENVLEKGKLLESLKQLKFVSIKPQLIHIFLPISESLITVAIQTNNNSIFQDAMLILVNFSTHSQFKISTQKLSSLMKLALVEQKMQIIQSFITNLIQSKDENIMKILITSGLLEYISKRFKLIFNSSEQKLNFISFLYGIIINSKLLDQKIIQQVINTIISMDINEKDEVDWIASTSLSLCGQDPKANKLILKSSLWEFIKTTLESKKSKLILHLLGFFITISQSIQNFKDLNSIDLFQVLQKTWQNRHPSIKPMIVQIILNLVTVPEMRKTKLFEGVLLLFKIYESHSPALKFQIGRLILSLLKLPKPQQWINPLFNLGILYHVKEMLNNQNVYMILLGIQIIGTFLGIDSSYVPKCEAMNIHIDVQRLQQHPSNVVYQWAKTVIDLYFKV